MRRGKQESAHFLSMSIWGLCLEDSRRQEGHSSRERQTPLFLGKLVVQVHLAGIEVTHRISHPASAVCYRRPCRYIIQHRECHTDSARHTARLMR